MPDRDLLARLKARGASSTYRVEATQAGRLLQGLGVLGILASLVWLLWP